MPNSSGSVQHVLSVLPRVTSGVDVSVSVACPRRTFGEIKTFHWWEVAVEDCRLRISSGGHFYRPSTGGDTFTTMNGTAIPEEPAEFEDYRESLWMVPDVKSFPEGVASVDFSSGGYSVEITDSENPLLEEDEEGEDDEDDSEAEEGAKTRTMRRRMNWPSSRCDVGGLLLRFERWRFRPEP